MPKNKKGGLPRFKNKFHSFSNNFIPKNKYRPPFNNNIFSQTTKKRFDYNNVRISLEQAEHSYPFSPTNTNNSCSIKSIIAAPIFNPKSPSVTTACNEILKEFKPITLERAFALIEMAMSVNPRTDRIKGKCRINGVKVDYLFDTGADMSIIDKSVFQLTNAEIVDPSFTTPVMSGSGRIKIECLAKINITIAKHTLSAHVLVVNNFSEKCLIGNDISNRHPQFKVALQKLRKICEASEDESNSSDESSKQVMVVKANEPQKEKPSITAEEPVHMFKDKKCSDSLDNQSSDLETEKIKNNKTTENISFLKNELPARQPTKFGKDDMNFSPDELTPEISSARKNIEEMLEGVIAHSLMDLGVNKPPGTVEHNIEITPGPAIKQCRRKVPWHKRDELENILNEMLDAGLITPSKSDWSSAIHLVQKSDGSLRITVDYRKVNDRTIGDAYPLPNIKVMFAHLARAKYFSKFDCYWGYYNIRMSPESKKYTAFACDKGLFEWNVMPMGLKNSGATFQRRMDQIFGDLIGNGLLVYMDDLFVYSETLERHIEIIAEMTKRLRAHVIYLKSSKCEILRRKIEFLGHVIADGTIMPNKTNTKALRECKRPTNTKEVMSFLGMGNYYSTMIKDFRHIAAPLIALVSKNNPFVWTEECQQAFDKIKEIIGSDLVMALPDFEREFILQTDACKTGIGGALSQDVNGVERRFLFTEVQRCSTQLPNSRARTNGTA